jgi:hypothetical protein
LHDTPAHTNHRFGDALNLDEGSSSHAGSRKLWRRAESVAMATFAG